MAGRPPPPQGNHKGCPYSVNMRWGWGWLRGWRRDSSVAPRNDMTRERVGKWGGRGYNAGRDALL